MENKLYRTLIYASCLQVLGSGHSVTQLVERDPRDSGNCVTDAHLETLDDKARQAIDAYYEALRERLPQEARAA